MAILKIRSIGGRERVSIKTHTHEILWVADFSRRSEILAMALLASMGFAAAFSSTFVAPATGDLQRKWNLSSEVSKLHVSM